MEIDNLAEMKKKDSKTGLDVLPVQKWEELYGGKRIHECDILLENARKNSLDMGNLIKKKNKEIKVLLLYTGGTFGMIKNEGVLSPGTKGILERLHKNGVFYDKEYTESNQIEGTSCTSETLNNNNRIRYTFLSIKDPIDSSEVRIKHYITIAELIETNYEKYDSFVIIYGTDTMGYMASQLSFMLENLNKTVVITGAQIPINNWGNDAESNLMGAFVAAEHVIPEVCCFFNGKLFRGNRTIKQSSILLDAFGSPNLPPLATFNVSMKFNRELIRKAPKADEKFTVFKDLEERIAMVYVHPLIPPSIFLSVFKRAKAVIIQTYGMGNFPLGDYLENKKKRGKDFEPCVDGICPTFYDNLAEIIEHALKCQGVIIVISSQCKNGTVSSTYQGGNALKEMGAILAEDMTYEAIIAKLSYLLGKGYDKDTIKSLMKTSIRGELTEPDSQQELFEGDKNTAHIIQSTITPYPLVTNSVIAYNSIKAIKEMVKGGEDLNIQDEEGKTMLHQAVIKNDEDLVNLICSFDNVDANIIDNSGNSPLYYACCKGYRLIVQSVWLQGGKLKCSEETLKSCFFIKAKNGNVNSIKLFNLIGADLNILDENGNNIAHEAAINNRYEFLKYLAQWTKVNIRLQNKSGLTPIDLIKSEAEKKNFEDLLNSKILKVDQK